MKTTNEQIPTKAGVFSKQSLRRAAILGIVVSAFAAIPTVYRAFTGKSWYIPQPEGTGITGALDAITKAKLIGITFLSYWFVATFLLILLLPIARWLQIQVVGTSGASLSAPDKEKYDY